jgi:competence ComEA-like helix-hairpin-helix protein
MKLKELIEVLMMLGSMPFVVMLHGCQENDWRFRECVCLEQPEQRVDAALPESELPACHWTDSFGFILPNREILGFAPEPLMQESADSQQTVNVHAQISTAAGAKSRKQTGAAKTETSRVGAVNPDNCVDINSADIAQLTSLPGVGKGRAEAIVQSRTRKPFKRKKDITRIKGIGAQSYRKMADRICEI